MLKILKTLGKGFATVTGIGAAATGGAIAISVDPSVNAALHEIGIIVTALGTLLASFGLGRKAGASPD